MNPQGSPRCHNFLIVTPSYHKKMTPIGAMHAKKIAYAVLLYVFRIVFKASRSNSKCFIYTLF